MSITLSNLKKYVPLKIWERGMCYYENGAVTDLKEISHGIVNIADSVFFAIGTERQFLRLGGYISII